MASLRPISYILASTNHGTMIVNRHDYRMVDANRGYGVGFQILNTSCFDPEEISVLVALLNIRRKHFGDGVVALDCGANIGVHTIECAKHMHQWGKVIAFEAQEKVYYALAGNIAINNCLNASAMLVAVGSENKEIRVPVPNYLEPASFGSLELKQNPNNEFIGQTINYSDSALVSVAQKTIDSLNFPRVDVIKIDIEGMEIDALLGANETIQRCKPIMTIEIIKSDRKQLETILSAHGYVLYPIGINMLAIHKDDPSNSNLTVNGNNLNLAI
jgi:FkbM family methyltransferase